MKKLKNLINTLKLRNLTVSLAESCSGGYVSYLMTKTPGSSAVFKGGMVAYSLEAKNKFFRIPLKTLQKYDGVSKKIAIMLAKRVRQKFNTDIGCSIVGFAGPSTKKGIKVGTVFLAVSYKNTLTLEKLTLRGSRDLVRKRASFFLIEMLYKRLVRI